MRKYLLTWYGITDLRTSCGFESSTGPILGALINEEFSDVVIHGYTNPSILSSDIADTDEARILAKEAGPASMREYIDRYANTPQAHAHFVEWLKKRLTENGITTNVAFQPIELKNLTDTEGIYAAATHSLRTVTEAEGDKQVTLFLSPGTPVMAFVWAFAALRYPNLDIRLIASSQPTKPHEAIALPKEWMQWHGRKVSSTDDESKQYDAFFHLFGEQRIPNLLGVLNFNSKRHYFVNSRKYPATIMKQFVGNAELIELPVEPFDAEKVRTSLLKEIEKLPADSKIGFNLTGGTKLMYAGALAACNKVNATPFYFNSNLNFVVNLNSYKKGKIKPIDNVEIFFKLNGDGLQIANAGHWKKLPAKYEERRNDLTNTLWQHRWDMRNLYGALVRYAEAQTFQPFEVCDREGYIHASLDNKRNAKISIGTSINHNFSDRPDFAEYLCGKWLEEYTYLQLKTMLDSGLIKDLRIGLRLSVKDKVSRQHPRQQYSQTATDTEYQELDVVFTDGLRLYIVECKAGKVTSEHVSKLQNNVRKYGGVEAVGILVTACFPPYLKNDRVDNTVVYKRITDAKNLRLVRGDNPTDNPAEQLKKIITENR